MCAHWKVLSGNPWRGLPATAALHSFKCVIDQHLSGLPCLLLYCTLLLEKQNLIVVTNHSLNSDYFLQLISSPCVAIETSQDKINGRISAMEGNRYNFYVCKKKISLFKLMTILLIQVRLWFIEKINSAKSYI